MKDELVRICSAEEVSGLRLVSATLRGIPYVVVRGDEDLHGFLALCSHKDTPFIARVSDGCLECPLHGVCFDASTGDVRDPKGRTVPRGLEPVEVVEHSGEVFVRTTAGHRALVADAAARRFRRAIDKRLGGLIGLFSGRK